MHIHIIDILMISLQFQEHRPLLAEHIRLFSDRPSVALSEARRFQPEVRKDWMAVNKEKVRIAVACPSKFR